MYKLVAIDLDGTLLNSYGEISNKNKETIQKAMKKNVEIVLTSGTSGIGKSILYKLLSDDENNQIIVNYGHNTNAANEIYKSLLELKP